MEICPTYHARDSKLETYFDNCSPFPSPTRSTMAGARDGARMASSLVKRRLTVRPAPMCAGRFASTKAEKASTMSSNAPDELADLDQASSFATPGPSKSAVDAFDTATRVRARESQLPGNR
jgi:hypothetical protein